MSFYKMSSFCYVVEVHTVKVIYIRVYMCVQYL